MKKPNMVFTTHLGSRVPVLQALGIVNRLLEAVGAKRPEHDGRAAVKGTEKDQSRHDSDLCRGFFFLVVFCFFRMAAMSIFLLLLLLGGPRATA